MIAALYVETGGAYYGIPDVDPWSLEGVAQCGFFDRDARLYSGPWPVVAHPPCARWCRLAGLVEHRYGYKRGEDGGCFVSALGSVETFGGVLEHPAYSDAWSEFGLTPPPRTGGWVPSGRGWTCHVEQGHYGHAARKATWLYAVGCDLPDLQWGPSVARAWVSWADHPKYGVHLGRISKGEASQTPPAFCDLLLGMARSVRQDETRRTV